MNTIIFDFEGFTIEEPYIFSSFLAYMDPGVIYSYNGNSYIIDKKIITCVNNSNNKDFPLKNSITLKMKKI